MLAPEVLTILQASLQQEPTSSPSSRSVPLDDEKRVSFEHLDYRTRYPTVNEAKLMRKIDFRLVPVLCILYLLAFLDRSAARQRDVISASDPECVAV